MSMIRIIMVLILLPCVVYGYTPPKGIPNPSASFSTFGEIDQASPSVATTGNPKCTNWPTSATEGCYYVDKTHGSATNTDNTYGYPDKPRSTPPEGTLAAGSLVYIHAGTYTNADSAGSYFDINGAGTALNPIWIIGNSGTRPIFQNEFVIGATGNTSYIVFENFEFSGVIQNAITVSATSDAVVIDHIIVRNCVVTGTQNGDDYTGINIGVSALDDGATYYPNATIQYVVVYNNHVSNIGNKLLSEEGGIHVGYHTKYIWVLDNIVHDISSDGIAGSHYSNTDDRKTEYVFIGRNTSYANGENPMDFKSINHFVISENILTGPCVKEQGWGLVTHYGHTTGGTVPCKDGWIIFNKIYGVASGTGNGGSSGCSDCNYIGNIIYDIDSSYAVDADPFNGYCFQIGGSDGALNIVDNTCYGYNVGGVYVSDLGAGDSLNIHGNIFSRSEAGTNEIYLDGTDQDDYVNMDYNRFYNSGGAVAFYWNGGSRNMTYIKETASECAHCSEGDPGLSNPPTSFALATGSACIGANVEGPVGATSYDAFATAWAAFGVTIEKDYAGTTRPQETTWDIGAMEYDPATVRPVVSIGAGAGVIIGSGATMTLY